MSTYIVAGKLQDNPIPPSKLVLFFRRNIKTFWRTYYHSGFACLQFRYSQYKHIRLCIHWHYHMWLLGLASTSNLEIWLGPISFEIYSGTKYN